MKHFLQGFLLALSLFHGSANAGPVDEAQALFEHYVALEHSFDPAAADLYADAALIMNRRTYPNGQSRELTMPAPQYKALIRQSMPLARARGDTSTYSDLRFIEEDRGVRVLALRFSNLKHYSSPLSLLIGPDATGHWLILEELSESRP